MTLHTIYRVQDRETGHTYVGCTRKDPGQRLAEHVASSRRSGHPFHVRLRERGVEMFILSQPFSYEDRLEALRRERAEILRVDPELSLNVVRRQRGDPRVDFFERPAAYTLGPADPGFMSLLVSARSIRAGASQIRKETGMSRARWDELVGGAKPLYLELVSIDLALQIIRRRQAAAIGYTQYAEMPIALRLPLTEL